MDTALLDALCAHPGRPCRPLLGDMDRLKVGKPFSLGLVVSMAHTEANLLPLTANIAYSGHLPHLFQKNPLF